MYIFSTFEYSTKLELAISELESNGIKNENIFAIPLDKREQKAKLFDSIHHSDGVSLVDLAAILGCIFMLLGSIYGFVVSIGPIFLGLIGLIFGLLLGFIIKYIYIKKNEENFNLKLRNKKYAEVILMIRCKEDKQQRVLEILWNHYALGVSIVDVFDHKNE